ncbi:MAG: hypothetical protein ACK5M7_14775, partial [Draconibacterium sp.]
FYRLILENQEGSPTAKFYTESYFKSLAGIWPVKDLTRRGKTDGSVLPESINLNNYKNLTIRKLLKTKFGLQHRRYSWG